VGTQYRSVIFYHDPAQEQIARAVIADLSAQAVWDAPIVTQVLPLPTFYPAESYHQDYYRQNPYQGYCQVVISPKLAKLRERHAGLLRA
jgi:peptide-methionine (S)-S-oxide reductase